MKIIAGVDEAGRGALAGPVVASAVILPEKYDLDGLDDSKKVSPSKREVLFDQISTQALSIGVGIVSCHEIDKINILNASLLSMKRALKKLKYKNIIISDDISMKALKNSIKINTLKAFAAGCNLILHCNANYAEMRTVAENSPMIDNFIIQKTSQFYHVHTDNQFPYRVYGTQQDNSAISVPYRTETGAITWSDCYITGTSESGYIVTDPEDSNLVYSGSIGSSPGGGGNMLRYDHST